MVVPALIAGLGALGGIAAGAVASSLGRQNSKKRYGVVFLVGQEVRGQAFSDYNEAVKYQNDISRFGRSSIIVELDNGLKAIRAATPEGLGVGARDFDATEEQEEITELTTRLPTPEWARRARFGPYPETDPGYEGHLPPIEPLFRQTTSSHEWKSDVRPWALPRKFFPGRRGMPSQPDMLVVDRALQYPEEVGTSGSGESGLDRSE